MTNGWIKIHRQLEEWEWYKDSNTKVVFIHCLLKAGHEETKYRGTLIPKGGFVTGLKLLSCELNIGVQAVRTALEHLKSTNELTIKSTNKGTLIVVNNWDKYQCCSDELTNKPASNLTNEQQTTNKQLTTNKNIKNIRNKEIKNIYTSYGEYKNVKLTDEQYQKLVKELPNDYQYWIDKVDLYCQSNGKKYKDYLATIRNWAKDRKETNGGNNEHSEFNYNDIPWYNRPLD